MTTMARTGFVKPRHQSRQSSPSRTPLVIAILVVILAIVGIAMSHALERHSEADIIRDACNQDHMNWKVDNKNFVQVCKVGDEFGFRIVRFINKKYEEVTAYFKAALKGKDWDGLLEWAAKNGWNSVPDDLF